MNTIHPTAIVYDNVILGDNIYIGPYCVIGGPPEHPDYSPDPSKSQCGGVQIMDNCVFHKHVTVDAAIKGFTIIKDNCEFMAHSHVGHDSIIEENTRVACGAKIGGHSLIGQHCNIGLNATIHQRSFVPRGTMLGAGSFFKHTSALPMFKIWVGSPAKPIKMNFIKMQQLGIDEG